MTLNLNMSDCLACKAIESWPSGCCSRLFQIIYIYIYFFFFNSTQVRYLGIPYKNGELGLHYLPEQIVWICHSYLLINIDMWGRIILICSNFNLKQVCGGGCSLSSPQMFWLVQLLKVVMSCHDLLDTDQFSRQT